MNKKITPVRFLKENIEFKKEESGLQVNQADVIDGNSNSIRAVSLIRSYRQRGHLLSKLDPLEIRESEYLDELHPENYGFSKEDAIIFKIVIFLR